MKLIILDRDGVINEDSEQFIKSPDEWHPIPGSLEAIARLNQWGWRVVVASNQSGVGRGLFDMDTLNSIHEKMVKALAQVGGRVDAIFFVRTRPIPPAIAASPSLGCSSRSPNASMSTSRGAKRGDSLRDLQAGVAVGCAPYLVLTGKGLRTRMIRPCRRGRASSQTLRPWSPTYHLSDIVNLIRSVLFAIVLLIVTPGRAVRVSHLSAAHTRYRLITSWTDVVMWFVRHLLGIRYKVLGKENLPTRASVILCKHQSAWETMALQHIFPPLSFVLKRELLRVPFLAGDSASSR